MQDDQKVGKGRKVGLVGGLSFDLANKFCTLKGELFVGSNFYAFAVFAQENFLRGLIFADLVDSKFFTGINFCGFSENLHKIPFQIIKVLARFRSYCAIIYQNYTIMTT